MRRAVTVLLIASAVLSICVSPPCAAVPGESAGYAEALTSEGRIIRGLTRDEAVRRYGFPDAVGSESWLYEKNGEKLYLYLPSLYMVNLYPKIVNASVGNVLEFKVYAGSQDSVMEDVTSSAEFIFSDDSAFKAKSNNVYVTSRAGNFTLIVKYKGKFSNASKIEVKPREGSEKEEELIKIEVLPYKPVIYEGETISFTAMGVYREKDGDYNVRDISDKVSWFVARGTSSTPAAERRITFSSLGEAAVYCTLEDIKAYPQPVTVEIVSMKRRSEELRHLTIMPEFMTMPMGREFRMTVMATYENNVVREVTQHARFAIRNTSVSMVRDEVFKGVHEGISEISAQVAGVRSGYSKVTVSDEENLTALPPSPKKKKNPPLENAAKDIDKEVNKLVQDLVPPEKKILSIRLTPVSVFLDKGASAKVNATAFNSDGSNSDVTGLVEWQLSDTTRASVERGNVTGRETGETELTASHKGIKSSPAHITVRQPRLLSIVLAPESLRSSRFDRPSLKAEGVYSDSARKDLTREVSWRVEGNSCLVDKGTVRPLGFGTSRVFARLDEVESLPATVRIVITPLWVAMVCAACLAVLLLICAAVLLALYIAVRKKAEAINLLKPDASKFVVALHSNLKDVFNLFGFRPHPSECPLVWAAKADSKFQFNGRFTALTRLWEEVRFSTHQIPSSCADDAGTSYGQMLKAMFTGLSWNRKTWITLQSLLRKIPLFL